MSKKSTSAPAALSESYLRGANASQLLGRLLDVYSALEAAAQQENQPANPSGKANATEFSVLKAHKGVILELSKREYLTNPNTDTQVAVACCLSCVLGGGPLASRGAPNPIPKDMYSDSQCLDILKLFVATFEYLQTATGKQSYHSYIRQTLEKLSARHGIQSLLARLAPSNKAGEADECSESLFKVFLSLTAEDDAMISQMASVICDAIETHQSLTETQLQLILTALTSATTGTSNTTPRRLALVVLRYKEEVVASAVGGYIVHEVEAAVEEMVAAEVAAIDDASEEATASRKAAVKRVGSILETTIAVCKVGVSLASGIIPRLQLYLTHDNNDIRLIFTRTFARIFQSSAQIVQAFTPAYHAFLGRFTDARVPIRVEMLKYAKDALLASPFADNLWAILSPTLVNKLIDSEESVRRAAVGVVVDVALVAPRRVPNRLYENLASRCKDKTIKVRAYAIERLSELFLKTRLRWIPNAIFTSLLVPGADASLVEFALSEMLPKPVDSTSSTGVAANRKKQSTLAAAGKQKSAYKFDFEKDDNDNPEAHDKKEIIDQTFLGSFVQLCSCFDDSNWTLLLGLMHKKAQLRLTCLRLVEFRQALKAKVNVEANTDSAIRLINFLSLKTNSEQWGALFKESDESATRWLHQLCDRTCTDYYKQGEVQLDTKVKGRAHAEIYKFLSTNILKRLCLPFSEKDVTELVATIDEGRKRKDEPKDRLGAVRALEAISQMAPHLLVAAATPQLTKWITEDADQIRRGQNPELSKVTGTSLRILSDIATNGSSTEELPKEVQDRKKEIITTLGKLCVGSEDGFIAKKAALCLTALFKGQTNAFHQLMANVHDKLSVVAKQGESAIAPTVISMIRTFGVFAATCPDAIVISSDGIAESITSILLTTVRAHREEDDVDATVAARKNPNGHSLLTYPCLYAEVVDACAKALTRHVLSLPGHRAVGAVAQLFDTFLKAFKETQALPTGSAGACKRRLALHKQLLRLLIKGEAIFASASAASAVAPPTTRRGKNGAAVTTAVTSQSVAGNLELMRKELSVVAMISSEDNDEVRHAVQSKLKDHILKAIPIGQSDTRKVAMLCMTAIAEDSKSGYMALKGTLSEISDRLNLFKTQQKVTLADGGKAWRYFLEYAVPPLVTYMAHHPTYQIEKSDEEAPFKHFQRPWQLLFDELMKDSTESASALQEMFRKLRALDDAIPTPPEDIATRVICDLGCKVLLTILGEKSVASGAPYPGSLLIPWYFIKPLDATRYATDQVFLPSTVHVTARPLFGAPVGLLAGGGAGAGTKPSQSMVRSGISRSYGGANSVSVNRGQNGVHDDDNDNAELDEPTTRTPAMTPSKPNGKRGRDVDDVASPQPKATTSSNARGAVSNGTKKLTRTEATSPQKSPSKKASSTKSTDSEHLIPAVPANFSLSKKDAQTIYTSVHNMIAKIPRDKIASMKFGEIRVAVQEAMGRKWSDDEKEYTKQCVGVVQEQFAKA